MVFYSDFIYYSGTNAPVVNAAVTVMIANTQTPAALFSDVGGTVIKPNPVTSDQTGFFSFYVTQGTYDLYFLGVKQYQISVNGTTGIPDPLTIQTLNVTKINPAGGDLLFNMTTPLALTFPQPSFQMQGTMVVKEEVLVYPFANLPGSASAFIIGTTTGSSSQGNIVVSDTATHTPSFILLRSRAAGALPITGDTIGRLLFGAVRPSTGASWASASVTAFAEGNWAEPVPGNPMDTPSSLRFNTAGATGASAERMRITNSGNVLIGTTVDDGVNKLQVNGPIKADSVSLNGVSITAATGTWTPVITDGSNNAVGGITYVKQFGNYTQLGDMVLAEFFITVSAITTPDATQLFLRLPVAFIPPIDTNPRFSKVYFTPTPTAANSVFLSKYQNSVAGIYDVLETSLGNYALYRKNNIPTQFYFSGVFMYNTK